jgi:hypothetical protein
MSIAPTQPHHDRRDQVARARRIIVERAQHIVDRGEHAQLLVQLAQRGVPDGLAGIDPAARQCPLAAMGAQLGRALGQQERPPRPARRPR